MLKGPTGCGKTRFVEHMAWRLGRPLVTISCHDDLTASDLIGRFLIRHDGTVWQDGPLTRAVREGAICYLDEVVEARQDTVVVLHPLTDHRRMLPIDKTGETRRGGARFPAGRLVQPRLSAHAQGPEAEHAPALRRARLRLSARRARGGHRRSTRAAWTRPWRTRWWSWASACGNLHDRGLAEVPSTRLLIAAARLIASGIAVRTRLLRAIVSPLSDEPSLVAAMRDLVDATFV